MHVFSQGLSTLVPEPNTLDKLVAQGVVREGGAYLEQRDSVVPVGKGVVVVEGSSENWDIHVVSLEDLSWIEDYLVNGLGILVKMFVDLVRIFLRAHGITVHDG